jgi:hypothetical protein
MGGKESRYPTIVKSVLRSGFGEKKEKRGLVLRSRADPVFFGSNAIAMLDPGWDVQSRMLTRVFF